MTDENLKERFEELQEQIKEYAKQIEQLKEDLKIVIRFSSPNAVAQARQYGRARGSQSAWTNVPTNADDAAFCDRCIKFAEKYSELEAT